MLLKLRTIFLCLFWYVRESDVCTNYHYFKYLIFLQDIKVFLYQLKDHICYCYLMLQIIFHTVYVPLSRWNEKF